MQDGSRATEIDRPAESLPRTLTWALAADGVTVLFIALVALAAQWPGFALLMIPELAALASAVFHRPHGNWARAPVLLVLTPCLTGLVGTLISWALPYGPVSVLLTTAMALLILRALRSPVAPALSSGLFPVTLGLSDWRFPLALLAGTLTLALLSLAWRRHARLAEPAFPTHRLPGRGWVPFYCGFVAVAAVLASATGWRPLLFPPLLVIGYEMFAHVRGCPWVDRPLSVPLACAAISSLGVVLVLWLGVGPVSAALSVAAGLAVLRGLRLPMPPALAVALLPQVIAAPGPAFPLAVTAGTMLLVAVHEAWRRS